MMYKYKSAIIGGTFDHFHKGHMYFIDKAFSNSEKVTIGVTIDGFSHYKKFSSSIESFDSRKREVEDYLKKKGCFERAKIIPINNIYGNSLVEKNIDVIFVDMKGYKNAVKINSERTKRGLSELIIITNPYIKDDEGGVVSSTNIRKGLIDRKGNSYKKMFATSKFMTLPQGLRDGLRKPFGKVVRDINIKDFGDKFVIAVGDIVVSKLVEKGLKPNISIYDLKTKRQKISEKSVLKNLPNSKIILENDQGTISSKTAIAIYGYLQKTVESQEKMGIEIIGEEDLLALPSILMAPLGAIVVYGIRGEGMVIVNVTEDLKRIVRKKYLDKFTKD